MPLDKRFKKEENPVNTIRKNLNNNIIHSKLRVIDKNGVNLGVISKEEALLLSREDGLDLVIVSETKGEEIPVAKIMDYSKKLYEDKKKLHKNKKKSQEAQNKEVRISLKIGLNDLMIKMRSCVRFLIQGSRVKVNLIMRGREKMLKDTLGLEIIERAYGLIDSLLKEAKVNKNLIAEKSSKGGDAIFVIFYLTK